MDDYLFVEVFEWKFRDGALCALFYGYDYTLNFSDMLLVSSSINIHKGQLHLTPF